MAVSPAAGVVPLAIPPLDCSGNVIYQIQRSGTGGTDGRLNAVDVGSMSGTTPVDATQATTSLIPAGSANALGITAGGLGAWALAPQSPTIDATGNILTFSLWSFDPATEVWSPHQAVIDTAGRLPAGVTAQNIASGGIVAGAIDPLSGNFYWAFLRNAPINAMVVFGWNTTTEQPIGVVADSNVPQNVPTTGTAATNGDIAFDGAGNLFVVSNTGVNAALGVIQGPMPTNLQPTTPNLAMSHLTDFGNAANNSFNGIAFNSTGELFIQWATGTGATADTVIQKVDPQTGAVLAGPSTVSFATAGGGIGVDLGACSAPPSLELQKNVLNRQVDTDEFALSITGGGLTDGNTATTNGPPTGIQTENAGPVIARVGPTYTFTETAAGTTNLANYTTTWECVDRAANNTMVDSGTGTEFTLAPTAGQAIVCTFTNSAARLTIAKTSNATQVVPGDEVPYTLTVQNTGLEPATDVVVTDILPIGISFVSSTLPCTAVGQLVTCNLGTIPAGAPPVTIDIVTVAADPFPPNAVDPSGNEVNAATVTSPNTNCPPDSTDPECNDELPLPVLARLTLVKQVENNFGGTAQPGDWTLNADGPTALSGPTGSGAVTHAAVEPGTYNLFESNGPSGYASGAWTCSSETRATVRTPRTVDVHPGDSMTCTLTNFDAPANLTLVKEVINDNGRTAQATDWTLNAIGANPAGEIVTGPTGSADVTNRVVPADTYALSETGGPPGYSASDWECVGGTQNGASITLAIGETATCTIVNNDIPPAADVRITKTVDRNQITLDPSSNEPSLLTYTLGVTNAGPDTATDVVVTDPLPSGTSFVAAVPSVGTCNFSGGTLTCALGDLANGATAQIVVTVAVPPSHPAGTLTNSVDVSTSTPDPDVTNNRAEASTVVALADVTVAGGALARTGAPTGGLLATAAVLLGIGGLLVELARRRDQPA